MPPVIDVHTQPKHRAANKLFYVAFCHVGWFVCVLGAARHLPWLSVVFVAAALCYHLCCAVRPATEIRLLMVTLILASVWESYLVRSGLLLYPNGILIPGTAPYWILALWVLFAMQFNVLFNWLKPHLWLACLLGALGGPLSFQGGVALGAATFPHPTSALIALGLGWGVLLPLLLAIARRWDGMQPAS